MLAGPASARCVALMFAVICLGNTACRDDDRHGRDYAESTRSYDGSSKALSHTVIVPTLDEPLPQGKNVIWCASFQIAWDRLTSDVLKEPPIVKGAEALCSRLNQAPFAPSDIHEGSYYAAAGFAKDGIVRTITETMKTRFPSAAPPVLSSAQDAIIAYAYLGAALKFTIPFFDNRDALVFQGSSDAKQAVASFGIRHEDDYAYSDLRKQVEVLYADFGIGSYRDDYRKAEYAVDLCKDSTPYQIVLACMARQDTLGATLHDLQERISTFSTTTHGREFGPNEVLLVPVQSWRIDHRFEDLEGKGKWLRNAGFESYYVDEALQTIEFRLDRGGAELKSETKVLCLPVPRYFIFDRPFLIYMKLRGADRPFFVMWIDNAELLSAFPH